MALAKAPRSAYVSEREFLLWHFRATNPKMDIVKDNDIIVFDVRPKYNVPSGSFDEYITDTNVSFSTSVGSVNIRYNRVPLMNVWGALTAVLPAELPTGLTDTELETVYREGCVASVVNFDKVIPSIDFTTTPITFKRADDGKSVTCTYTGLSNFNEVYSHDKKRVYRHVVPLVESE